MPNYVLQPDEEEIDYGQKRRDPFDLAFSPETEILLGQAPRQGGDSPRITVLNAGAAAGPRRGSLSERYESSGRGPGTVSTGRGDHGGVSYGPYQLATNEGRPGQFLAHEGNGWQGQFAGMAAGTPAFSSAWKAAAAKDPQSFGQAQHDYIDRTHYRAQLAHIKKVTGVDLAEQPDPVQDVIWSTSVQHGPDTDVITRAMKMVPLHPGEPGYNRALIGAIYDERGRKNPDGSLVRFPSSSPKTQSSVADRFARERQEALRRLDAAGRAGTGK